MNNLKQFIEDEKGNTIGVQDAKLDIDEVIGWISDHDQLYEDFQDHFDYAYDEASGEATNTPELDDALYWISEHETAWEDFKLYFNLTDEDEVNVEAKPENINIYYDVTYKTFEGDTKISRISIPCSDNDDCEEERLCLMNTILELSRAENIKEVLSIDFVGNDEDIEEDDDYYDAGHAQEWMERNPHGYYNSEKDYAVDDEDDTLEYAFKDNFR